MAKAAADKTIFDWQGKPASYWRLAWYLILALVCHVGFFYFFTVVTPTASRPIPKEQRMMRLSMDDPATAALLRSVEHKVPGMFLPAPPVPGLAGEVPRPTEPYVPSYADYAAKLASPLDAVRPLPSILSTRRPTLPPLGKAEPIGVPMRREGAFLELSEALQKRGWLAQPVFPSAEGLENLTNFTSPVEFTLGVAPDGAVANVFCANSDFPASFMESLRSMRFQPHPLEQWQWEKALLHW
jgi:hypothetical protein